jgi:mannan endo-1,6-alpha-mannosidase
MMLTTEQTNESKWLERVQGLVNASDVFFKNDVMYEVACEDTTSGCDNDEDSFKAYMSRWMAATAKLVPEVYDTIMAKLKVSAVAAAEQCSGGTDGVTCGLKWTDGSTWDGTYGVGQQMAAMQIILSQLVSEAPDLVTNTTGGTSKGNSAAGSGSASSTMDLTTTTVTSGDKVGAGFLTAFVLCGIVGGTAFMVI